jgi:hypothetical protein
MQIGLIRFLTIERHLTRLNYLHEILGEEVMKMYDFTVENIVKKSENLIHSGVTKHFKRVLILNN